MLLNSEGITLIFIVSWSNSKNLEGIEIFSEKLIYTSPYLVIEVNDAFRVFEVSRALCNYSITSYALLLDLKTLTEMIATDDSGFLLLSVNVTLIKYVPTWAKVVSN